MSAFTVADEHIHVLVTAGLDVPYRPFRWTLPEGVERIQPTRSNGLEYSVAPHDGYATRALRRESADAVGQMLLDQRHRDRTVDNTEIDQDSGARRRLDSRPRCRRHRTARPRTGKRHRSIRSARR